MKLFRSLFNFLGGIYCAIFLIGTTALFVIIGTFLEAHYDSHLYAAHWTYQSPLFAGLLFLFFINILFSALRRWPFKVRHIPFLITHFGLLMIIAGCLMKHWFGLQGNMLIMEGGSSQDVIFPHTHALHIESRDASDSKKIHVVNIPLSIDQDKTYSDDYFPDLLIKLKKFNPHINERLQGWIRGNHAYLYGVAPIPVQDWNLGNSINKTVVKFPSRLTEWDISVVRTDQIQSLVNLIYQENVMIKFTNSYEIGESLTFPLSQALNNPTEFQDGQVVVDLDLHPFSSGESPSSALKIKYHPESFNIIEEGMVPLQGQIALYHRPVSSDVFGSLGFDVDLLRIRPQLLIVQDSQGDSHLFAFDMNGRFYTESFSRSNLRSLFVYDEGFGGYAIQANIPFPDCPCSRKEKEAADQYALAKSIDTALISTSSLSPPLKLFKHACDELNIDFSSAIVDFLFFWHKSHDLLFPKHGLLSPQLMKIFQNMNWGFISQNDLQTCQWICLLYNRLEQPLLNGEDIYAFLKRHAWPFIDELEEFSHESGTKLLRHLSEKMFDLASYLPIIPKKQLTPGEQAHLFSAYLKAFGIEYHLLYDFQEKEEEDFVKLQSYYENMGLSYDIDSLNLEGPLTMTYVSEVPFYKLEENRPGIWIEVNNNSGDRQLLPLAYESSSAGFKWPALKGQYLFRYQPKQVKIPYKVRLRQARQINFVDSNQPQSYESDVLFLEEGGIPIEKTLSMNHVYETWDGYRFYLAGITTLGSGLKRVQIVVNYDPVKYYLTYPGGIILSIGIVLLFWLWPYKSTLRKIN